MRDNERQSKDKTTHGTNNEYRLSLTRFTANYKRRQTRESKKLAKFAYAAQPEAGDSLISSKPPLNILVVS